MKDTKNTKFTINEFIEDYENNSDQFYGFYDWFCNDRSLKTKAKSFVPKLKFLVKEGLINGDKNYVWFKNNCPANGSLYDDMRFSTMDDNDFIGGICPKSGHDNLDDKATIWYFTDKSLVQNHYKNWSELKKALKTDTNLRTVIKSKWLGEG